MRNPRFFLAPTSCTLIFSSRTRSPGVDSRVAIQTISLAANSVVITTGHHLKIKEANLGAFKRDDDSFAQVKSFGQIFWHPHLVFKENYNLRPACVETGPSFFLAKKQFIPGRLHSDIEACV